MNTQINDSITAASINSVSEGPLFKLFPNDPMKLTWSFERPTSAQVQLRKNRQMLAQLNPAAYEAQVAAWKDEESNFEVDDEKDDLREVNALLEDLNRRARGVYEARRVKIVRRLSGSVTEFDIDSVRFLTGGMSPEKVKQAVTTGTVKIGKTVVSNGVPVSGVEQATIDMLDNLILKGKDEAKNRREQAARNKAANEAIKSGEALSAVA